MITHLVMRLTMPFYPIDSTYERRRLYPMGQPALMEDYVSALRREAEASAPDYRDCVIHAVSVSGGIAGHAADGLLGQLLRDMRKWYVFSEEAEVTLNVHPGMVSAETLDACRRGGVTRLSVDYCTGNTFESEAMRRFLPPSAMDVTAKILKGNRLDLSFDLLVGLPGQSRESLCHSLEKAEGYGASEIVLHPLQLIPGTVFKDQEAARFAASDSPRKRLPDDGMRAELLSSGEDYLAEQGFIKVETEARDGRLVYALPGKVSRYHQLLKEGTMLLGFGSGAVTRMDGIIAKNTGDLIRYIHYSPDPVKIVETVREDKEGMGFGL